MEQKYYVAQVQDKTILNKSGSGGIFYSLAKIVLINNGVVFGAAWANNFKDVVITEATNLNELEKLLTAKYVCSSMGVILPRIKDLLDNNKLVLFSGLPCQVTTLKSLLKKDYPNLFTVEVCCHGTLSPLIWRDYLKTIERPGTKIVSINMRDKRNGWTDFGFAIKYSDGYEFFESKKINKYMKAFLSDKYLNSSCYDCKFKNEFSKADLILGDFWNYKKVNLDKLDINAGLSLIVINTNRGLEFLNKIPALLKYEISKSIASGKNGGMHNKIETQKIPYNKKIFTKIGIVTLTFNNNIGGVLQGYALQKFLENNYYDATVLQNKKYKGNLEFIKKFKTELAEDFTTIKNKYNVFIVGSDQIWRRRFLKSNLNHWEDAFLNFCKDENVHRIAYAASCGTDTFDFEDVADTVAPLLNKFDSISVRESAPIETISKLAQKEVVLTCDPTLLLTAEEYINNCKEIPTQKGLFAYILDKADEKTKVLKTSLEGLNLEQIKLANRTVEDWLAAYRDCSCILTDSYHGVLFSIIFNKPFICFYNKERGNSRFENLIQVFNIKERFIENSAEFNIELLKQKPNLDITDFVEKSKKFLLGGLEHIYE